MASSRIPTFGRLWRGSDGICTRDQSASGKAAVGCAGRCAQHSRVHGRQAGGRLCREILRRGCWAPRRAKVQTATSCALASPARVDRRSDASIAALSERRPARVACDVGPAPVGGQPSPSASNSARDPATFRSGRGYPICTPTMPIPFVKMHGAGNDFVVIDQRATPFEFSPDQVRRLADRRVGIGCDQFITLHPPPPQTDADLLMRIRNPDGSEAGACGNATRCVAELLFEQNGPAVPGDPHRRRRPAGRAAGGRAGPGRHGAGPAGLGRGAARGGDGHAAPAAPGDPAACSMGNPHVTFFVGGPRPRPASTGRRWERDALFPEGANVGFAADPGAGPHAAAGLGARRRADARLRLGRLRGAGERASARADRAARRGGRWMAACSRSSGPRRAGC